MMKNLVHLRNTKKSWIVYAIGLFLVCSICLGLKVCSKYFIDFELLEKIPHCTVQYLIFDC